MTTVFLGMLAGVLIVGLLGVLSARAARRHPSESSPVSKGIPQPSSPSKQAEKLDPMELAAVGAGQPNGAAEKAHTKVTSGN